MTRRFLSAVLAATLLSGCDRRPADTAQSALTGARLEAARDACIARELATTAEEGMQMLEQFGGEAAPGAIPSAALVFARAAEQHARLRHAALARADSAINHTRTPADSARFIQAAEQFVPRPPEPGTLEANVASAWIRDFAALRANEDHRCHWDP